MNDKPEEYIYEVGDVAELRSGGPRMTVSSAPEPRSHIGKAQGTIALKWLNAGGQMEGASLDPLMVRLVLSRRPEHQPVIAETETRTKKKEGGHRGA